MNISDEIIKVLNVLCEKFGIAVDWTSNNIVPYLQQLSEKYIRYEVSTSIVWIILWIILLGIAIRLGISMAGKCMKKYMELSRDNDWDIAAIFCGVISGIVILVSVIGITVQCFDIVTCITLPEKIILRAVQAIYNSMK